jgi:RNA polymerase sigma-70 factor, ECF subfamily
MTHGNVTIQDAEDVRRSLNGDGQAYTRLVERYQASVASRMWRFTRDTIHHQELVQDVFVQAFLSLKTYKGKAPLEHWIGRITTNVGYRYWKNRAKDRARQTLPLEEWDQMPFEDPETTESEKAADLLDDVLGRLPPRDRVVLMLRYVENFSVEETAEQIGWTQTMVKVQAWRARKKLKTLFQEAGLEVE